MNAILARLRRGYARMWAWTKRRVGFNHPGWPTPPQDEGHAYYRTQHERLVATLPTLPRGQSHPSAHERRNVLLAFAANLEGLHNYGDDPILPPGIRRIVIRENQTRLAAFGEVEQPSFFGRFMGSLAPFLPYILIGGLFLTVTGWGAGIWNGWRADRWEARATRNHEIADHNYRQWEIASARATERLEALVAAQQLTRATADALTSEREARARAAARERRRVREIQNVLTGAPEPPAWRLRDDEPAADSTADTSNP